MIKTIPCYACDARESSGHPLGSISGQNLMGEPCYACGGTGYRTIFTGNPQPQKIDKDYWRIKGY